MNKAKKIFTVISLILLAACGTKKSNDGNAALAEKKAKLEQLKKQQDDLTKQIASLQAEIIKQDPSASPEKANLVAVQQLSEQDFSHYINLQGSVNAENIAYVTPRGQGGQGR